jgi:hypothetical protein
MRVWARRALAWKGNSLHVGGKGKPVLAIEPDRWPGMWRIRLPDGSLTDMLNLSRARDAAMAIALRILQGKETRLEAPRTAILTSADSLPTSALPAALAATTTASLRS